MKNGEMQAITLDEVKAKLKERGYAGLYVSGECGCTLDDLAPCGECRHEDGEEYVNGCEPGYIFLDPRPGAPAEWMIRGVNKVPSMEEWDQLDRLI